MEIVAVWLLPRQHATNQEEEMIEASVVFSLLISQTLLSALLVRKPKTFLRVSMHVLVCAHRYMGVYLFVSPDDAPAKAISLFSTTALDISAVVFCCCCCCCHSHK